MIVQIEWRIKKSIARHLYVLWVLVQSTVVCAADVMHEQRLFFTKEQRELLDSSIAGIAGKETVQPELVTQDSPSLLGQSSRQNLEGNSNTSSNQAWQLFFNGSVKGQEAIHVLINGLPCQPLSINDHLESGRPRQVICPHLNGRSFKVMLHLETGQVVVQLKDSITARLEPGDSF